jgi:adenylosuccinate synthase
VREYKDLPLNAKQYVERVEELTGVRAAYISVGPERNAIIIREECPMSYAG